MQTRPAVLRAILGEKAARRQDPLRPLESPPLLRLGGGLRVAYDPVPWGLPRRSEQRFPSQHGGPAWRHSDTQNLTVGLGSPRTPLQATAGVLDTSPQSALVCRGQQGCSQGTASPWVCVKYFRQTRGHAWLPKTRTLPAGRRASSGHNTAGSGRHLAAAPREARSSRQQEGKVTLPTGCSVRARATVVDKQG